jgi:bifunctional NMN adenylyltransferase/nudix hydrolase
MEEVTKQYDIGVIIGRFQVHELHDAHKEMIEEVLKRHNKVILFLGVSPTLCTQRNPLDFMSRKVMFEEEYGNQISVILPLHDKKSDNVWSNQVDTKIREVFSLGSVVLYGSRDSFIPHYKGKFDVKELVPSSLVSATEIRKAVSKKIDRSKEFRAGVIYACYNSFPIVHPVIDVAILNDDETQVLLGRKKDENEFRFIGGFADVTDENYEQTVRREAFEETGLEIGGIEYVASMKVRDWRYRSTTDRSIMTSFFKAKKISGHEQGADDIVDVLWFDVDKLSPQDLVGEHGDLFLKLKEFLAPKKPIIIDSI